ncbi:GGDEF domain-containing protein [Thiohalobacter sp.]|uniref:GGDEF domain-containing protein n=1 Tax=Thiohalobacter sp. TaxID=2025948 RepID=UPI002608F0C9|nr:diguanylate cyclase [Thiohalobacter sp.]
MEGQRIDIKEIHWLMDMLQSIDVGLVILDRNYDIRLWNSFMESHSGRSSAHVMGENLFEQFPEIPQDWFRRKAESVFLLRSRAFCTWEQRPWLLRFKHYRPITGTVDFMYQNITLIPLSSATGEVEHIGLIVYDVTDMAVGTEALEQANAQLAELSRTDRLTGLYNRGFWEECLNAEFARYRRTRHPCTLVMFDIDHFKKVNDTYGHQAGDEVIRVTSKTLQDTIRATDIAGRYGGEEFGIILVNTSAENGLILAERLRTRIEALTVETEDHRIDYTISLGLAEVTADMDAHTDWIEHADQALYRAKQSGRNRAIVYGRS